MGKAPWYDVLAGEFRGCHPEYEEDICWAQFGDDADYVLVISADAVAAVVGWAVRTGRVPRARRAELRAALRGCCPDCR